MKPTEQELRWIHAIRSGKIWSDVQPYFEALAHEAGVPDDWKDPDSTYTLETVMRKIQEYYQVEIFRTI